MADIFEYLDFQAEVDDEPMRKAAAIALSRSESSFAFLKKASSKDEFDSRLSLIEDGINNIIEETCEEFGYDDPAHIAKIVNGQIQLLAADVETGDSYYQRRDDLPSAPADGSLSEPSPKLDPGKAGDQWHTFQDEPEVESVRHRNERQAPQDVADYAADLDESHPLVQRVDADTPMQPEFNVGDNTKVFPNTNQAQPVTSAWTPETLNPSGDLEKQKSILDAWRNANSPDEAKRYLMQHNCLNSDEADMLIQNHMSGNPAWGGPLHHGSKKKVRKSK